MRATRVSGGGLRWPLAFGSLPVGPDGLTAPESSSDGNVTVGHAHCGSTFLPRNSKGGCSRLTFGGVGTCAGDSGNATRAGDGGGSSTTASPLEPARNAGFAHRGPRLNSANSTRAKRLAAGAGQVPTRKSTRPSLPPPLRKPETGTKMSKRGTKSANPATRRRPDSRITITDINPRP